MLCYGRSRCVFYHSFFAHFIPLSTSNSFVLMFSHFDFVCIAADAFVVCVVFMGAFVYFHFVVVIFPSFFKYSHFVVRFFGMFDCVCVCNT